MKSILKKVSEIAFLGIIVFAMIGCAHDSIDQIPEGFVKVTGVSITGDETWEPASNVFVSGQQLTIPTLIVCDHEVTRGEFKILMGIDPSTAKAYNANGTELTGDDVLNNPVNYVNWYEAIAYCNKLSMQEGLTPCYSVDGISDWKNLAYNSIPVTSNIEWDQTFCDFSANGYRLPTEAEWEWIARGGENYIYAGSNNVNDVAWYTDNTDDTGSRDVKTKDPNGYGLYDMSGNVFEWCWDIGTASDSFRTIRGGSWFGFEDFCRVDNSVGGDYPYGRSHDDPYNTYGEYGFRVVRNAN